MTSNTNDNGWRNDNTYYGATGHNNIIVGLNAGINITTGHHNIIIGDGLSCEPDDSYIFMVGPVKIKMSHKEQEDLYKSLHAILYKP